MTEGHWFTTSQFSIQPGEEDSTNPGCFGKYLAEWLAAELARVGYSADVIPEDWGWCVMVRSEEFLLWAGCGCVLSEEILQSTQEAPPDPTKLVWYVFTAIEVPFFKLQSQLRKWTGRLDLKGPKSALDAQIKNILTANDRLTFCDQP